MQKKQRIPMGAIAATHYPGFKHSRGETSKFRQYLILPHDPLLSENIGKEQGSLGGTETEVTEVEYPAGSGKKHKFHIVDADLLKKVLRSSAARGRFEAFERRTPDGPLYPYRSPEQIANAKARRAKNDFKRTRVRI